MTYLVRNTGEILMSEDSECFSTEMCGEARLGLKVLGFALVPGSSRVDLTGAYTP
jgi:hypothetical protein